MNKSIERKIVKIAEMVFKKLFSGKQLTDLSKGDRSEIIRAASILEMSDAYNDFATKYSIELAKQGVRGEKGIWRKYYNAAKKLHYVGLPKTLTDYEAGILRKAIEHNFHMIKTIPSRMLETLNKKYASALIEEVVKGTASRGSFAKMLASHGHKHAKLIARTETAKLQTTIAKNRAVDVGSIAYEWLASNDKRTRPSHRAMNGVIVFWRNDMQKPLLDNMRGDAGEFPNCRCSPQPIVDIDELTESFYKVYDYRTDKIVRMGKNQLIEAIENKSLR